MSIQTDVPHKLIQVAVWALALHPAGETYQGVDVFQVCGHLQTLCSVEQHYNSAFGHIAKEAESNTYAKKGIGKTITCLIFRFVSPSKFDVSM